MSKNSSSQKIILLHTATREALGSAQKREEKIRLPKKAGKRKKKRKKRKGREGKGKKEPHPTYGSDVSSTNAAPGPNISFSSCTGNATVFESTLCTFSVPHDNSALPPIRFTPA